MCARLEGAVKALVGRSWTRLCAHGVGTSREPVFNGKNGCEVGDGAASSGRNTYAGGVDRDLRFWLGSATQGAFLSARSAIMALLGEAGGVRERGSSSMRCIKARAPTINATVSRAPDPHSGSWHRENRRHRTVQSAASSYNHGFHAQRPPYARHAGTA